MSKKTPVPIKLSSPATREFWEIAVLHEDAHLLALNKPAGLLVSPDRAAPERPALMPLLHAGIAAAKPWAVTRGLTYLANAYRLDAEASGLLLLAKSKPILVKLVAWLGSEKPALRMTTLVAGTPREPRGEISAKLAPHPTRPDRMHVDSRRGKRSRTIITLVERFRGYALLHCDPLTLRRHQVRVHLRHLGLRVVGDAVYGGEPLLLSQLKPGYRLKRDREERPLIAQPVVHVEALTLPHPVTGQPLSLHAPWPKSLNVAVKYLRQFATLP